MRLLVTACLWAAAVTLAVARRLTPVAIFIARELILAPKTTPQPRLLTPAAGPPLPPPATAGELSVSAEDLSALTRRQLQEIVGTRRNLPKAVLLEMAANRPLAHS
jgi:hypothetical protein